MNDWHFTLKNIPLLISSSELHRNLMMLRPKLVLFSIFSLTLSLSPDVSDSRAGKTNHCGPSLCGNVIISHPFRLEGQPDSRFELECKRNRTSFPKKYGNFYVLNISYVDETLRLVDVSLVDEKCSIPRSSIVYYSYRYQEDIILLYPADHMYLVNCTTRMKSSSVYVDASRCPTNSSSSPWTYFYFPVSFSKISDFHHSCRIIASFLSCFPILVAYPLLTSTKTCWKASRCPGIYPIVFGLQTWFSKCKRLRSLDSFNL